MKQIYKWWIVDIALVVSLVFVWQQRHFTISNVIDFLSSWSLLFIILILVAFVWGTLIIIWRILGFISRKIFGSKRFFSGNPAKQLLPISLILIVLYGMTSTCMCGARSKARDAKRQSDMRQLISAQETYYGSQDRYMPSAAWPQSITDGTTTFLTVPVDPGGGTAVACGSGGNYNYCTFDNSAAGDEQEFCYYGRLENNITSKGSGATACTVANPCPYVVATQAGTIYRRTEPATLAECTAGAQ